MKQIHLLLIGCVVLGMFSAASPLRAEKPPADGSAEGSAPAICDDAPPGHHPGRGRQHNLSTQQEKQLLEFLQENMKDHYEHLMKLRERNPRAYRRSVQFFWPKVRSLLAMPEAVREAHIRETHLRIAIFHTIRDYRQSKTDQDREANRDKLQTLLTEKFDVEQKVQEYRLQELAEQLQRLRTELHRRARQRDQVIAEQLQRWLEFPSKPFGPGRGEKPKPRSAPTTQPTGAPGKEAKTEPATPTKTKTP